MSNPYMDDANKMVPPHMRLQNIMTVINIGTEKCHKISEAYQKSMKQKKKSNLYIDDATEMILPIRKCLPSIIAVNNIGTEKQMKVSEA